MRSRKELISLNTDKRLCGFSGNGDFALVALLTILALVVRLISLRYFQFIGVDGGVDGVGYAVSGKNLFSGLGYSFQGQPQLVNPPLYPVKLMIPFGAFLLLIQGLAKLLRDILILMNGSDSVSCVRSERESL